MFYGDVSPKCAHAGILIISNFMNHTFPLEANSRLADQNISSLLWNPAIY